MRALSIAVLCGVLLTGACGPDLAVKYFGCNGRPCTQADHELRMKEAQAAQEDQMRRALRVQECMQDGGAADACYDQHMKEE